MADEFFVVVNGSEASNHVDLLAERRDVIGSRDHATGEQLTVLESSRDDAFLRRLSHRQDVLVFVDDGVANDKDAITANAVDQFEHFRETAVVTHRPQVLA